VHVSIVRGTGSRCDVCGEPINAPTNQIERTWLEGPRTVFHGRCFEVLIAERRRFTDS
jgi:hypothetical protein